MKIQERTPLLELSEDKINAVLGPRSVMGVVRSVAETREREDAFYVCDVGDIVRKHDVFKSAMPRVEPHYAVKCNDSCTVLSVLASLGTGFDCASRAEVDAVLSLGVEPERIIFANPAKPRSHITHAILAGVDLMTFDCENELQKIKKACERIGSRTPRLVLRIRCDAVVAQCPLGLKFGCDPIEEAPRLLRIAKSLDLNVVGVSFHVGSGCGEPPVFRRAISAARDLFDYGTTLGYSMDLLDIGGGFPGDTGTSILPIAEVVNGALDEFFPESCGARIIAEPGRFYVASAYTLTTHIHSKRVVESTAKTDRHFMYYIDDGVYGSFNCILYDHQVVKPMVLKPMYGKLYPSSVWGPTCDSLDRVVEDILLPELDIGDWLVFENMGAYTIPVASPFNGFPVPRVFYVSDIETLASLSDGVRMPTVRESVSYENIRNELTAWANIEPVLIDLPLFVNSPAGLCGVDQTKSDVYEYVEAIGTMN